MVYVPLPPAEGCCLSKGGACVCEAGERFLALKEHELFFFGAQFSVGSFVPEE